MENLSSFLFLGCSGGGLLLFCRALICSVSQSLGPDEHRGGGGREEEEKKSLDQWETKVQTFLRSSFFHLFWHYLFPLHTCEMQIDYYSTTSTHTQKTQQELTAAGFHLFVNRRTAETHVANNQSSNMSLLYFCGQLKLETIVTHWLAEYLVGSWVAKTGK